MSTPVSLPLTATLPAPGTVVLPTSITSVLPPSSGYNTHSHSNSGSFSHSNTNATTKILLLSNFSPELKTRDIQLLFGEWEDERGGFKIKWVDDVSCWIVFADAGVAKRAYLTLLSSPPPALRPADDCTPKLNPYTGSDVSAILTAVQNRPRSRSNATSMVGGHSRKGSLLGSGGAGVGAPPGIGAHARKASYGREGGQRLSWGGENGEAPPVPALPEGFEEAEGGSPVAVGEAGRRMVNAALGRSSNGGMTKSDSKSGADLSTSLSSLSE